MAVKYSRFDPKAGHYEIYEDRGQHEINADLPVPELRGRISNIGVPAGLTGRPLPPGAKRVGTSWHPIGQIVTGPSGGLGSVGEAVRAHPLLAVAGAFGVMWALSRLYVRSMTSWGER